MNMNPSLGLERLYGFFQKRDSERWHGLDESYFHGLTPIERNQAWNFILSSSRLSDERIRGLFLLDSNRAIYLFKEICLGPIEESDFPAERKAFERARLALLHYINLVQPTSEHMNKMCSFALSNFKEIRTIFATSVPEKVTTPAILNALKSMIFTEADEMALSSAVMKFMAIYGMEFDADDKDYKVIYNSLRSGGGSEKLAAIKRLEKISSPILFGY